DAPKLDRLIAALADATLTHEDVFGDMGHGALVYEREPVPLDFVAVTGPRRSLMHRSSLPTYLAVPYGDMMIAGCFGMIRARADVFPGDAEAIYESLNGREQVAPWELIWCGMGSITMGMEARLGEGYRAARGGAGFRPVPGGGFVRVGGEGRAGSREGA